MVMNENVIQELLKLDNATLAARLAPGPDKMQRVEASVKNARAGLETWARLTQGQTELAQLAQQIAARLDGFETSFASFREAQNGLSRIRTDWDLLIKKTMAHLEKTMEEVIDPHKVKAAEARDIAAMNLWGDIDMVMNEAVIANFLKLQTVIHDYAFRQNASAKQSMTAQFNTTLEGLEEWKKTLAGRKLMEQAAGGYWTKPGRCQKADE